MKYIFPLRELDRTKASLAGGKGASLGEMLRFDIPVPDGFVVLSSTFEEFIEQAALNAPINEALRKVDLESPKTIDIASEKIQKLIRQTEIPLAIAHEIASSFKSLGTEFVAVRSSATAEDGAEHAWAGQLDSHLNTTFATLLENVKKCWASLFTPRAIFYRFEKGLQATKISVAVVIQEMVDSEKSGIAFSVHPITEDSNQLIIEAGYGLGEAIVTGTVTPDSYVVEKQSRKILEIAIGGQTRGLFRKSGGGNEWKELGKKNSASAVLNDNQINELANIVIKIEQHYGFPCDIEWAYQNKKFYIVQARPITTIKNKLAGNPANQDREVVVSHQSDLLTQDLILTGVVAYCRFREYGFTFDYPATRYDHASGDITYPVWQMNEMRNASLSNEKLDALVSYLEAELEEYQVFLRTFKKRIGSSKNKEKHVQEFFKASIKAAATVPYFALETVLYKQLEKEELSPADIPSCVTDTTLASLEIDRLGNRFKTDLQSEAQPLSSGLQKELKKFCDKFGYLGMIYFKGEPWNVADAYGMLSQDNLLKKTAEKKGIGNSKYLQIAADLLRLRTQKWELMCYGCFLFRTYIENNFQGLVRYGDLLHLRIEEVVQLTSGLYSIAKAGKGRECFELEIVEKKVVLKVKEKAEPKIAVAASVTEVKGAVAFSGKVIGTVKVVKTIKEGHKVQNGDILVTRMSTPDYLPFMRQAAAFVTDIGGITSHAAIVARELEKPCIIGTKNATEVLHDGDRVEVDADHGIVRILEQRKKSVPKMKKDDYVLTFWAEGVSPLITDISRDGYAEMEVLYIIDHGTFKQYFPKKAYERSLNEGLLFYGQSDSVERYRDALNEHIKSFEEFYLSYIRDKEAITQEVVANFFKYAVHLSKEYLKMGFEYTDKAFAAQDENEVIRQNLLIVAKYKDEVREFVNRAFFTSGEFLLDLLDILARQFSIPTTVLENLTQRELLSLFEGSRYDTEKLSKRREVFVCAYDSSTPLEGEEGAAIVDRFTEGVASVGEIKGQTASKGRVSGKVKIIPVDYSDFSRVNSEIDKMDQGDILVAETTAPELIVACKKAGAIVTDMGGLMSHAAIVSREFGIPCIVGTGNGSKILKDGDIVEVDADEGIVRRK